METSQNFQASTKSFVFLPQCARRRRGERRVKLKAMYNSIGGAGKRMFNLGS